MKIMAIVAHPDDIEFLSAGTLLLLKQAGHEIHFWNLADGCYGSETRPSDETARIREEEARESATIASAFYHRPLFKDLGIFYDGSSLAKVISEVREVRPDIVITHPPMDYMEDHQNTCRLAVTAAFARGVSSFPADPPRAPFSHAVRVYHTFPNGLTGPLEQQTNAHFFIDVGTVMEEKRRLLACHRSQQEWLDASQGISNYIEGMVGMCSGMGMLSGKFKYAEGFIRHSHVGFAEKGVDPLPELLKPYVCFSHR